MDNGLAVEFLREWLADFERFDGLRRIDDEGAQHEAQGIFDDLIARAAVINRLYDRIIGPNDLGSNVLDLAAGARETLYQVENQSEIERMLGDAGPRLLASQLHPMVWDGAKSFWRSGHYREAVHSAAKAVNAQMQAKVGRRDTSDARLAREVFSRDEPKEGRRRLRLMPDDGSETYRSTHDGAGSYTAGAFQMLRNPAAHEPSDDELDEQVALEQLAVFSVIARLIDDATVSQTKEDLWRSFDTDAAR